jgi:hypothetical protein
VVIGGLLSYWIHYRLTKRYPKSKAGNDVKIETHKHQGLLLSCGIVAGASLMGVVLAIPFAIKESSDALRIMPDSLMPLAGPMSVVVTVMLCVWIYRVVMRNKSV